MNTCRLLTNCIVFAALLNYANAVSAQTSRQEYDQRMEHRRQVLEENAAMHVEPFKPQKVEWSPVSTNGLELEMLLSTNAVSQNDPLHMKIVIRNTSTNIVILQKTRDARISLLSADNETIESQIVGMSDPKLRLSLADYQRVTPGESVTQAVFIATLAPVDSSSNRTFSIEIKNTRYFVKPGVYNLGCSFAQSEPTDFAVKHWRSPSTQEIQGMLEGSLFSGDLRSPLLRIVCR